MMNKRTIQYTAQYKRDYKKAKKQGRNMNTLSDVLTLLAQDSPLPKKYCDHALQGNWKGHRECHIAPDWLLVYKKTDKGALLLVLVRLATHSLLNF